MRPMIEADRTSYVSAADLAERIRRQEISAVELMTATIQRIQKRNPSLNAFVFTDFDQAMERARAADQAVTSGATLGPLHGVPTAMNIASASATASASSVVKRKRFAATLPATR